MPASERERVGVIIEETVSEVVRHSGPLPSPADLAGYDAVQAGFAERIVAMAEAEQRFRHDVLKTSLRDDRALKRAG